MSSWVCSHCFSINRARRGTCYGCGQRADAAPPEQGGDQRMWLSGAEDPLRTTQPTFLYTGVILRGLAYLIDSVIIIAFIFVLFHPAVVAALPSLLLVILLVAVPILYFVIGWAEVGTTVGMRIFRLSVVRAHNGEPDPYGDTLGYKRALVRFLSLMIVSWIIPVFLAVIPIVIDEKRRGIHDRIAGTVVIRPTRRPAPRAEGALSPATR